MSHLPDAIRHLVAAVENLARAVRLDDKTSLGNSTALGQDAAQIGSNPEKPDVIVFGDLNRFKQINDQFGHSAGDAALRYAGHLIDTLFVQGCRARAYRRSGDEFILVLEKAKLEMFREKVLSFRSCSFMFNDKQPRFAMSFGYACTDADGAPDFPTLLDRAEQACIVAKSRGDGTCVEWTSELASSQEVVTLRSRCPECSATIVCDMPAAKAPQQRRLRICPACETRLDQEMPLLPASDPAPVAQPE
jgi:diguanylate cyclase (GGDEF)-like protein